MTYFANDDMQGKHQSLRLLEWLNVFLADVQTDPEPFLAAYLASSGWNPGCVGYALTFRGLVTVALQAPAGAVIDGVHRKRALLAVNLGVLVAGALLLMGRVSFANVYSAQLLIGSSGAFLGPSVAAITLGIVGAGAFDKQFGRNQAANSAGNVFGALLVAYASYRFGYRAIFMTAAFLAIPTAGILLAIDPRQIDYARARGQSKKDLLLRHRSVHVGVHHRNAVGHNGERSLDWETGCDEWTKTTVASWFRRAPHTRSALCTYSCSRVADRDSDAGRRGQRRICCCLDSGYQR